MNKPGILVLSILGILCGSFISIHSTENDKKGECIEGNCQDGIGRYDYTDGLVYEGSWADGLPNGHGKVTIKEKEFERTIEGNFAEGDTIGIVFCIQYENGYETKYEGEMKDFRLHGNGKFTYKDGSIYEGMWVNGVREGNGKMIFSDGRVYTGEFKKSYPEGHGIFEFHDNEKYEGEFYHGRFHGHGTYYYSDGSKYVGSWKDDKEEGEGILYDSDGNISQQGKWVKGLFANPLNMIIKDSEDIYDDAFYIYTLDVFRYYNLLDKYDTELKRVTYTKTKEYQAQLDELKKKKKEISSCWLYYNLEKPFSKESYNNGESNDYNIKKKGFIISSKSADYAESDIILYPREGDVDNNIGVFFKTSSLLADSEHTINRVPHRGLFFLPMGQEQGLMIENNREKCDVHFLFKIVGSNVEDKVLYASPVRVIVAHEDSGEVYYDKTFTSEK